MSKLLTFLFVLFLSLNLFADADDDLVNDAVLDTQAKMKSAERGQLLQSNDAKKANDQAIDLVGKESLNETYALSADILPVLIQQAGSPEKAAQMLEDAKKNPEEFFKKLPPEIQAKISGLAGKVETRKNGQMQGRAH